jgi:hypothetical protein
MIQHFIFEVSCLLVLIATVSPDAEIYFTVNSAQLKLIGEPMYRSGHTSNVIQLINRQLNRS